MTKNAEEDLRQAPAYDVAIGRVVARLARSNHQTLALVQSTACFCRWYEDEDGTCPQDGVRDTLCLLREDCARSFADAQRLLRPKKPRKKKRRPLAQPGDPPDTRYQRTGYTDKGRPVDLALQKLCAALGNPPSVSVWKRNFLAAYGHLGPIVLCQTASYTKVVAKGRVVVCCWTNASHCMAIDVISALVPALEKLKGVHRVWPLPPGTAAKLKPCTHRFELTFNAGSQDAVISAFGVILRAAFGGLNV